MCLAWPPQSVSRTARAFPQVQVHGSQWAECAESVCGRGRGCVELGRAQSSVVTQTVKITHNPDLDTGTQILLCLKPSELQICVKLLLNCYVCVLCTGSPHSWKWNPLLYIKIIEDRSLFGVNFKLIYLVIFRSWSLVKVEKRSNITWTLFPPISDIQLFERVKDLYRKNRIEKKWEAILWRTWQWLAWLHVTRSENKCELCKV